MRSLSVGWAAMLLLAGSAGAQEAIPVATVGAIKEATAYVRTSVEADPDGPAFGGTAFLIRADGTTGYLATNSHVVTAKRGENPFSGRPTTVVHFRSGTKKESKATAEIVANDPRRDLAILRVTGVANLPKPVDLTSDAEPFETMSIYIFGFPFGEHLALGEGHPPVNVGRGQVSSLRRDREERLTSVLLDGALNPGNSGGPVVDSKGRLVGVARATIRGANIGFAIAVPELLAVLEGTCRPPDAVLRTSKAGPPELAIEAPLLDPLGRVKSAKLLFTSTPPKFTRSVRAAPADAIGAEKPDDEDRDHAPPPEEPDATYGPIEGAKSLAMAVEGPRATGILALPNPAEDASLWLQVALVDGSGKPVHSRPARLLFGRADPTSKAPPTAWGEVVDPDGDCKLRLEGGDLVGEVPGTLHDLNVDIGVNNAPRVVRPISGDFVATVKVSGSFRPGTDGTGPKSYPANLCGLVAWLDGSNYIRLERGSMNRKGRVVGFVNFECRENGAKNDGHNRGNLDPSRDLHLKMERKGKSIVGSFSEDGRSWDELGSMEIDWPESLRVGVDLINSCGDPMTGRFHGYSLDRPASKAGSPR